MGKTIFSIRFKQNELIVHKRLKALASYTDIPMGKHVIAALKMYNAKMEEKYKVNLDEMFCNEDIS